jgi:putative DNA primase/helicase
MTDRQPLPKINFKALGDALLPMADALVQQWIPDGVQGSNNEYRAGSVRGGKGESFSVNLRTGKWSDFATGEAGVDLVSLYASAYDMTPGAAAIELANAHGLADVAGIVMTGRTGHSAAPVRPVAPVPSPKPTRAKDRENWTPVLPAPANAAKPTFWHHHRNSDEHRDIIDHTATYQVGDDLYGFVIRFLTASGDKDTLPYVWCMSEQRGEYKWVWRQFGDSERPLYLPGKQYPNGRTVVMVEGEKKADILQHLLDAAFPGVYCVASWPGGCKAWQKANWQWLAGSKVLLWPDCDAKREKLTRAEEKAFADDEGGRLALELAKQAKPLLAENKQPGMQAMLGIGAVLRDTCGCTVSLLPIPAPGVVMDGWDCADAIVTDGWTGEQVAEFLGRGEPLAENGDGIESGANPAAAAGGSSGGDGSDDGQPAAGGADDAFSEYLNFLCEQAKCKVYDLGVNRKMIITALRKSEGLQDCLGLNLLTGAPSTQRAWPWRSEAGPLADSDDLRLGDWLSATYKIKAASRSALAEAIATVADERPFHPIRDWLDSLKHDGVPRLEKWLIHVLGMNVNELAAKRRRYLELVGKYLLGGLVARVVDPGCKFDYSPVFEGVTGVGKSTLARELVGKDFFSDTHFDIGNGKDGMEQLEGLWAYELSEMTAFRKADNEQVKQFFSSMVDRFRGAYGKFVQKHPRQCVIICTTNKRQYLYDLTGNRRFWPVWIDQPIKLDWIRKYRAQLFAEAYAAYKAGERYAPTREEEDLYFVPEQELRLVETGVQSKLYQLLTRDGAPSTSEGVKTIELNIYTTFVTLDQMIQALGSDVAKSTTLLEGQIRGWLEAHGWTYGRESTGQRRRGYKQPKVWPPQIPDDLDTAGDQQARDVQAGTQQVNDDEPF